MPIYKILLCIFILLSYSPVGKNFGSLIPQQYDDHISHVTTNDCCIPSKVNVNGTRANIGFNFLRRLINDSDSYKEVNSENMCNLIHFLFQKASFNNKSVVFTKGVFVIFDSTHQLLQQLLKAKNEQKSGDEAEYSGYLNRIEHISDQAVHELIDNVNATSDTFIYLRGDESSHYHNERGSKHDRQREYPAYGMDIPKTCMPSDFGHLLFGKLPPIENNDKYSGDRMYIKPELFGIRQLKQFFQHAKSYLDHVSKNYLCQLKHNKTEFGCTTEYAFRENTDKALLNEWNTILMQTNSLSKLSKEFMNNATKYGLMEIYRQAKQIETTNEISQVNEFLDKITQQYGHDDIGVRKGREIIFTISELVNASLTCENFNKSKIC